MAEQNTYAARGDTDWQTFLSIDALRAWMDTQSLGHGPIADAHLLGGGTQNILLKFIRAGRTYVLRRPPKHLRANSNETMRREARVLAALKGEPVPHPDLIAACPDETVLGASFYLMEPIEGFTPREEMPPLYANDPKARHTMGLEMVDAIAALSKVDYAAKGLQTLGKLDNFLERQVGRWKSQLESYAEFAGWPVMRGALRSNRTFPKWKSPWMMPGLKVGGRWALSQAPTSSTPGMPDMPGQPSNSA